MGGSERIGTCREWTCLRSWNLIKRGVSSLGWNHQTTASHANTYLTISMAADGITPEKNDAKVAACLMMAGKLNRETLMDLPSFVEVILGPQVGFDHTSPNFKRAVEEVVTAEIDLVHSLGGDLDPPPSVYDTLESLIHRSLWPFYCDPPQPPPGAAPPPSLLRDPWRVLSLLIASDLHGTTCYSEIHPHHAARAIIRISTRFVNWAHLASAEEGVERLREVRSCPEGLDLPEAEEECIAEVERHIQEFYRFRQHLGATKMFCEGGCLFNTAMANSSEQSGPHWQSGFDGCHIP